MRQEMPIILVSSTKKQFSRSRKFTCSKHGNKNYQFVVEGSVISIEIFQTGTIHYTETAKHYLGTVKNGTFSPKSGVVFDVARFIRVPAQKILDNAEKFAASLTVIDEDEKFGWRSAGNKLKQDKMRRLTRHTRLED